MPKGKKGVDQRVKGNAKVILPCKVTMHVVRCALLRSLRRNYV